MSTGAIIVAAASYSLLYPKINRYTKAAVAITSKIMPITRSIIFSFCCNFYFILSYSVFCQALFSIANFILTKNSILLIAKFDNMPYNNFAESVFWYTKYFIIYP